MKTIKVTQAHIDAAIEWDKEFQRRVLASLPLNGIGTRACMCVIARSINDSLGKDYSATCGPMTASISNKDTTQVIEIDLPYNAKKAIATFDTQRYDELKPFEFELELLG